MALNSTSDPDSSPPSSTRISFARCSATTKAFDPDSPKHSSLSKIEPVSPTRTATRSLTSLTFPMFCDHWDK